MITPVAGIQHAVSLVDGIAGIRSNLPPLVVAVTSTDGCETARGFLKGYHRRLSVDDGRTLVPHAWGSDRLLAAVAQHSMPDVELLNQLAGQLSATMPPGAGRRWRPFLFETCHDVLAADDVPLGPVVDQRRTLRDRLYNAWEKRTPWLAWIQTMAAAPNMANRTLGAIATALLSGPNRWWFGRRLNSGTWRWFGEHVTPVTGLQGDFLCHALSIVPVGALHDNSPLRRRILVDALLHDLDRLVRQRRFLPHHRRRRWTPVLSLDCTADKGLLCLDVVQSFVELTESTSTSPLLVIAAMEPATLESAAGPPHSVKDAVERLQKYVNRTPSALVTKPWLPVLLSSEPEDRAAGDWLEAHRKVIPRIPGKVSAWAPIAITAVITLAATAFVIHERLSGYCADTRINDLGERFGLSDGRCDFAPAGEDPGFARLRDLERQITANNEAVDNMRDTSGEPRDYRKVVFFAPLTRPSDVAERTAPANALWQLQGAVEAQEYLNTAAKTDESSVPIKLLLANSGDKFKNGPDVASDIAEQPLEGPGSVAAVIGISQSLPESLWSFENMRRISVIGSSMYGNQMTDGQDNFFMIAPPNDLFAQEMAAWAQGSTSANKYTKAVIVYDTDDDYFSEDLRDDLHTHLPQKGITLLEDLDFGEENPPNINAESTMTKLCDYAMKGILPVLASRADQLATLFTAGDQVPACRDNKITMLAGGGAIVSVASGQPDKHTWLTLAFTALADSAAASDEATGYDALLAASGAINTNASLTGNEPTAIGVLQHLSAGFTINNGKTGRFGGKTTSFTVIAGDRKDPTTDRIKILETTPNS